LEFSGAIRTQTTKLVLVATTTHYTKMPKSKKLKLHTPTKVEQQERRIRAISAAADATPVRNTLTASTITEYKHASIQ
jgi:hypothetical protein